MNCSTIGIHQGSEERADFVVDKVFVPDGRWTVLGVSKRQIDRPLFGFLFLDISRLR